MSRDRLYSGTVRISIEDGDGSLLKVTMLEGKPEIIIESESGKTTLHGSPCLPIATAVTNLCFAIIYAKGEAMAHREHLCPGCERPLRECDCSTA